MDEHATTLQRLEAKRTLRDHGYGEVLDQRVREHVEDMKARVRREFIESDPEGGAAKFDALSAAVEDTCGEFREALDSGRRRRQSTFRKYFR